MEVFLKRLTREEVPHPDKLGPDVEVRVYRELFDGTSSLPVPTYLGSSPFGDAEGFHLLLEYIPGRMLKHCPPSDWVTAARRLGELHRFCRGAAAEGAVPSGLLQMDAPYYLTWAVRAAEVAADSSPKLAWRIEEALRGYEHIVDTIVSRPQTLVHNDLSSRNVLVSEAAPSRVCFVDWETAGMGCGLVDLIHMKYNRLDAQADRAASEAYIDALGEHDLVSPDERSTRRLLDAVELHFTLYRIAHSAIWGESVGHLTKRVERAAAVRARIDKTSS